LRDIPSLYDLERIRAIEKKFARKPPKVRAGHFHINLETGVITFAAGSSVYRLGDVETNSRLRSGRARLSRRRGSKR
jgi:hypothetical protein